MKFLVLHGSPKGDASITLQYVRCLERMFPEHQFDIVHAAAKIVHLEKNPSALRDIAERIRTSDAVLWAFGVFVMCVPSQLMRFIELIQERGLTEVFSKKPAAVLSTSIHYFDNTAHQYLRAVCEDFDMRFCEAVSFDIGDLHTDAGKETLRAFFRLAIRSIADGLTQPRSAAQLPRSDFRYLPDSQLPAPLSESPRAVLLTDAVTGSNAARMDEMFARCYGPDRIRRVHLDDVPMNAGCKGCMQCGYDYTCRLADGFSDFYNETLRPAEVIVFSGTVRGRYLSSRWKRLFDRAFFWNHTPSLEGKQIGFLISGPLHANPHLSEILEATVTARQLASFAGIVTDEDGNSASLDKNILSLAHRTVRQAEANYVAPRTFSAVGGMKIFRDDIWGRLRAVWQADFRYYKAHGLFDFPHRRRLFRIMGSAMQLLCKISWVRRRFYRMLSKAPPLLVKAAEKAGPPPLKQAVAPLTPLDASPSSRSPASEARHDERAFG